jgi:hypothetical protein
MSAVAQVVEIESSAGTGPAGRRRVLAALGRIEALRVVRHPGILLGALTALAVLPAMSAGDAINQDHLALLGMLTFLVGFLNEDRARRDGAAELYETLPAAPELRSGAILFSMAAAGAVACALAVVAWVALVGLDGSVTVGPFTAEPSPLEIVQGPLLVTAFGMVGVFLGRWTARPVLAPLLMIALLIGPIGWNIPWVLYETVELAPGDWVLGDAGWHLLFLGGVGATASALTLLCDSRRPWNIAFAVAGLAALVLGAALQ